MDQIIIDRARSEREVARLLLNGEALERIVDAYGMVRWDHKPKDNRPKPLPEAATGRAARLPDRLQRRKRLQQPDAHIGDRAGEEADAGDHHQHTHGALDIDELALHPREQF